eukprot:11221483-Lingulodinium_polyedra.AAC.1
MPPWVGPRALRHSIGNEPDLLVWMPKPGSKELEAFPPDPDDPDDHPPSHRPRWVRSFVGERGAPARAGDPGE